MVIPIHDVNPTRRFPIVTKTLIAVNVVVYIAELLNPRIVELYSFVPALAVGGEVYRWITHMFLHGSLMHILGNMLYLWIFGDNVEDYFGRGTFLALYIFWGVVAAAVHMAATYVQYGVTGLEELLYVPAVGASGAISGVLGAYAVLYPHARIVAVSFIFIIGIITIPAWAFIGFWFIYQLIYGTIDILVAAALQVPGVSGVAYWAHIGGFVAGALTAYFARPRRRRGTYMYQWSDYT